MIDKILGRLDKLRPPILPPVPFAFALLIGAMVLTLWWGRRRGWW